MSAATLPRGWLPKLDHLVALWRVDRMDARIHEAIQRRGLPAQAWGSDPGGWIGQLEPGTRRLIARRERIARATLGWRRPGRVVLMLDRTGWGWSPGARLLQAPRGRDERSAR